MDDPKRILIVRPSALGDVCRTVGVLVSLRKAYPEARIDWVVQEEFSAAIRSHPALNGTIEFPRVRLGRWWRSPARAREVLHWLRELRQGGYDLVFDLQGLGRSGMMTWVTGAKRRVGRRWARELGWLGYNVRHPLPTDRHTVEQMMALLVAEGIAPVYDLTLYVAQEHRRWWASQPQARGAYAVLAPTSRWPSKRWPAADFSALIGPLLERGFDRVIMIGSPREVDQTRGIAPADCPEEVLGTRFLIQRAAELILIGQFRKQTRTKTYPRAEVLRNRLPDVGQRAPRAQVDPAL